MLKRVWQYGRPYGRGLIGILGTIVVISSLSVVPAILIGILIDDAIPRADVRLLTLLGLLSLRRGLAFALCLGLAIGLGFALSAGFQRGETQLGLDGGTRVIMLPT